MGAVGRLTDAPIGWIEWEANIVCRANPQLNKIFKILGVVKTALIENCVRLAR